MNQAAIINVQDDQGALPSDVRSLATLLADSYVLALKTQNYHWNVTGPQFVSLHALFEAQYTELAAAIDEIAERIRALGFRAPGTWREFAGLTEIDEDTDMPTASDMLARLHADHEAIARRASESIAAFEDDAPTADLLTRRVELHQKTAWMLASLRD